MERNQKYILMTESPVSTLVSKLAIPTIISMLITSLYSIADTYFVSQIENPSAAAAVGIIFSMTTIIQAIGLTFGIGASNSISIYLGQKNQDDAKKILAVSFFSVSILCIIIATVCLISLENLVYLLGATDTIAPFAMDYAKYILIASPFMAASLVLNTTLRSQGNAMYAMVGLTIGAVINIALDPIFIFVLDLGIAGAAIATGISQLISLGILFFQSNFRRNSIKVKFSNFTPKIHYYKEIFAKGFPNFIRLGLGTVASVLMMKAAGPYGDYAIAAIGIINRVVTFMNSLLIGFGQGFQPVSGFNFGAKKYDRVIAAYYFSLKTGVILTLIISILGFTFSENILMAFRDEPEIVSIGSFMLKAQCLVLPLQAVTIITNMLVQSIGFSARASLLSSSRQGLFFIPLVLILPNTPLGLLGLQITQPIADIFAVSLALYVGTGVLKQIKESPEMQMILNKKQG